MTRIAGESRQPCSWRAGRGFFGGINAVVLLLLPLAPALAEPVRLANAKLQIGLDSRSGELREFRDLPADHNHVVGLSGDLWEIQFASTNGPLIVSPAAAKGFHAEPLPGRQPRWRLVWSEFDFAPAPELSVEVEVQLDSDGFSSWWGLRVANTSHRAPNQIRFPRIGGLTKQTDERLAAPVWQGQLCEDPRALLNPAGGQPKRFEWEYPGILSLQCLAVYREGGPGLYLACDDTAAQRKKFAMFGGATGDLGFEIVHVPEQKLTTKGRFELPYRVVLSKFTGDWFTAAERYRDWAMDQSWARRSRLRRGLVPDWVLGTGLWVWNRGRSPGVLTPAVELQQELGLPVSVLWHWWHGCSYDTGFPEYLPPREGAEPFKAALAAAQAHDVHALVYMNQRLWGMTTPSWTNQNAERFAVKDASGKVHREVYNTFTKAPCAPMCMGTGFWRDTYADLVEQAVSELGVDGIYMDQACTSLACYDPTHGHALGGGSYWMQGFRELAADIRQRVSARAGDSSRAIAPMVSPKHVSETPVKTAVALAGEGCGEPWLPYLDLMLSLQISRERYSTPDGWETIPFFNAVYHDCVLTFGNYSSLTMPPYDDLWPTEFAPAEPLKLLDAKFSQQFRLEQLRAFVWGQQPTVANLLPSHLGTRAAETEFAAHLAKLRRRATQFLVHGTMLRPPRLNVEEREIPMSRLSIYAGQQGGLKTFEKRVPLALASAWRAPDGRVAIALGSISDEPTDVVLDWSPKEYGLRGTEKLFRMEPAHAETVGAVGATGPPLRMMLPPRAACVLEFRR